MLGRRRRAGLVVGAFAVVAATVSALPVPAAVAVVPADESRASTRAEIPLYSDRVVLSATDLPLALPVEAPVAGDPDRTAAQDRWLAEGHLPGPDRFADLAESALRDMDALTLPDGAVLAAATGIWRYVWPRDASFVAAALARTGHDDDALGVLLHLQDLQGASGVFEARYLPDGSGDVPDDRGPQLDGSGWVLWGVSEWYHAAPRTTRDAGLERLRPLVTRAVAAIRTHVDPATGLPTPSPDYWEVDEDEPTLGTAAVLLLGLRAADGVLAALGEPVPTDLMADLRRGLEHFAPDYGRYVGTDEHDTAVAFLMPPFAPPDDDVTEAWEAAALAMARPAGGLAPGAGWRDDGVSWTPTTAVFALTAAASGDREGAVRRLDWLDRHRTAGGALPEKVLWDGSPSAVAPLAWTCALVLLTLDELDRLDAQPFGEDHTVQSRWVAP